MLLAFKPHPELKWTAQLHAAVSHVSSYDFIQSFWISSMTLTNSPTPWCTDTPSVWARFKTMNTSARYYITPPPVSIASASFPSPPPEILRGFKYAADPCEAAISGFCLGLRRRCLFCLSSVRVGGRKSRSFRTVIWTDPGPGPPPGPVRSGWRTRVERIKTSPVSELQEDWSGLSAAGEDMTLFTYSVNKAYLKLHC